ncbi:CopG family transcriptional regulator [Klebsiella pneumoniae]
MNLSNQQQTQKPRVLSPALPERLLAGKPKLMNFRLPAYFEEILEAEAQRTGQSKTTVLKAALAAFDNLDENLKNHWLLESAKLG